MLSPILIVISIFLYSLLQISLFPIVVAYLIVRKFNKKSVFGNLLERVGFIPKVENNQDVIWLHAVSVGEVLSIQYFVKKIKEQNPNTICYLTVGTTTGKKIAQKNINADYISFLPYDCISSMFLAYKRINPKKIIIVEAETWPNLLMLAKLKRIPIYLINARINKKSKNRLFRFKAILRPLFNIFEKIYTQSESDKLEFEKFGIKSEKLHILGNIKAYNVLVKRKLNKTFNDKLNEIRPSKEKTLLVGSIHPGELDCYTKLFTELKLKYPELKLILAPRHFFWKEVLINKVKVTGYSFAVWDDTVQIRPRNCDILLVCKLGELFGLYKEATAYFLGGTFVPIGGHNLLEPTVWSNPIFVGPYHHNSQDIVDRLVKNNGIIIANNQDELIDKVTTHFENQDNLSKIGKNARQWLDYEGKIVEDKLNNFIQNYV